LFLSSSLSAAESPFRYSKNIDRRAATKEEILAAVLDGDIYAATREGYPDVRILDESGAEVPFVLEQANELKTEHFREGCASVVKSLREGQGNSIEIIVQLRDKAPSAGGLTIVTPFTDYEHRVRVFGLRDDQFWTPLVSDGLVFDYTRYMDIRSRDVTLPRNEYRQFKVVVEQVLDQLESPFLELTRGLRQRQEEKRQEMTQILRRPFRIDRIDMWRIVDRESERKPVTMLYEDTLSTVEKDEKVTRITVQVHREPLTGLILQTASRNFSRAARVMMLVTQGVRTNWMEIGRGTISRFQFRGFHDEKLRIDFPEHRAEQFQIIIEDEDNPPLQITSVHAVGNMYRLVFLTAPEREYRVVYGSATAESPRYDVAAVLASIGPGYQPKIAGLDKEIENPSYRDRAGLKALINTPIVLFLAMGLMIVVLAYVLLRAGKQIKKLPDPEIGPD
jgi:hypothetical protein